MGKVGVSTIQTETKPAVIPKEVIRLTERFREHQEAYQSGQYNEAQLRQEFINPFFEALGWDVNNKQGRAEAYKDVIHEDSIKIGGATKAPDYCFRIGGIRKDKKSSSDFWRSRLRAWAMGNFLFPAADIVL